MLTPQLLTTADIDKRFDLERYYTNYFLLYYIHLELIYPPISKVVLFDGDTTINSNLDTAWAEATLKHLNAASSLDTVLILINGNLQVEGDIRLGDQQVFLLVKGNLQCDVLENSYDYIHVTGDVHIRHVFYGHYNRGYFEADGKVFVPYVLTNNYYSPLHTEGSVFISLDYRDKRDVIQHDYTREVLTDVLIPEVFNGEGNIEAEKFIAIVQSGQSPFN